MIFSRKRFLCGATAMGLSMPLLMRSLEAQAAASNSILVVVQFDGGNDLFNTVVDQSRYGRYHDLRSNIALAQADLAATAFDRNVATPPAAATQFALHPNMAALRALYGKGKVAILAGVGIPGNSHNRESHEQAKYDWASGGTQNTGSSNVGWLGATFDQLGNAGVVPAMISLDNQLPLAMHGRQSAPLVLSGDIGAFAPTTGNINITDSRAMLAALDANDNYALASVPAEFARSTAAATLGYVGTVRGYASAQPATDYSNQYVFSAGANPSYSYLKDQFKQVARLTLAGAPSRAYWLHQYGYDTHSAQLGDQGRNLGEFSEAVAEFYTYMMTKNAAVGQNVIVMTVTDFGRRPESNASAGTDHGTATVSFIVGAKVIGGFYGAYPDLTQLDSDGNALVAVDFRNQLSDVVSAMGADPALVVGQAYPKLGFI